MKDKFGKADKSSADRGENCFEKRNYKNEVTIFRKKTMLRVFKNNKKVSIPRDKLGTEKKTKATSPPIFILNPRISWFS